MQGQGQGHSRKISHVDMDSTESRLKWCDMNLMLYNLIIWFLWND